MYDDNLLSLVELAGKNDLEEAQCQMIVLTMEDMVKPIFDCYHHIRQDLYPENDETKIVSDGLLS